MSETTITEPLPAPTPIPLETLLDGFSGPRRAWMSRGPARRVDGAPDSWLLSPGDCYIASVALHPDDIDLIEVLRSAHRRIGWLTRRRRELTDLYRAARERGQEAGN